MKVPRLDDLDLAYEVGLHIGDGCMSHLPHGYRYVVSGNLKTESEYYESLVVPLIQDLYGLDATISRYNNSIYATVWSKSLVEFKSQTLGLPIGRKDVLNHLPVAIVREGRDAVGALLAGLYDADGSVKVRKTPSGDYPRISLAQKTRTIIEDVRMLLSSDFGITSTMYVNRYLDHRIGKTEVRWFLDINGYPNFYKFIAGIGARHPTVSLKIQRLRANPRE